LHGTHCSSATFGWTYHYSKTTMNWTVAREWCQERHTDMVVIQNQDENNYLVKKLPIKKKYYWIGITKQHKNETWTWIGNNSTWIGNESWAPKEPNNNHSTEFCVEIYVNNDANRGKWNDEKCANKKYAACYKAQCNETSCDRGRCQETIENITCLCEPGYEGDRCQTGKEKAFCLITCCCNTTISQFGINKVILLYSILFLKTSHIFFFGYSVECPLSQPDNGYLSCSKGNRKFNSTCRYECYSGFLMIGSPAVTCGLTGVWSGPRPTCASNYLTI
uniref:Selectin E n=1 Tax=Labrus bergylta TaxID=56723 RepID=A0A3Q3MU46_9LABR